MARQILTEAQRTREAERDHAWYQANKERKSETGRAWYRANKERRLEKGRAWNELNRERKAGMSLKRKYNITLQDKMRLLEEQGGVCAVCGSGEPGYTNGWHTDHIQGTKFVRGILCRGCNTHIGGLGDDTVGLLQAALYVARGERKMRGLQEVGALVPQDRDAPVADRAQRQEAFGWVEGVPGPSTE